MARYERDYGRDFGRWGYRGAGEYGGMRSDAQGGDWRNFPGEEGWYGEGYEGMPGGGFGRGLQGGYAGGGQGFHGGYGGGGQGFEGGFQGGYGGRQGFAGGRGGYGGGDFDRGNEGQGGGFGGGYGGSSEYSGWGGGSYGARGFESGYGGRETGYGGGGQNRGGWSPRRDRGGFGNSRASEIMTENPETVTADASITDVARRMRDLDVGIIPVVESKDNKRLRGLITDRDITIRAVAEGKDGNAKVADCMTDRVRSVNKNDSIQEVMRVMRQEQVRRVPVTDREGRLVGIIAQADLAVDYAGDNSDRDRAVGETVEQISEPAQPERSGSRMAASGRGSQQKSDDEQQSANRSGGGKGSSKSSSRG